MTADADANSLSDELQAIVRNLKLMVFDFDGVMTDNTVLVLEDGTEAVRCWRGDGLGLARLATVGVEAMILSTEVNPVVSARAKKLGLDCVQGSADKLSALHVEAEKRDLGLGQVGYMGNDINDAGCLAAAGLPVVVCDASAEVLPLARLRTRAPGGRGAVRELCDMVYRLRTEASS